MAGARQIAVRARRERIIAAAREWLAVEGTEPAMRPLAAAAGLSVATLYNLFGSKEAILVAVLEPEIDALDAELGSTDADAPLRWAEALLDASLRRFVRNAKLFRPLLGAIERQGASAARTSVMNRSADLLAQAIVAGVEAGQLSDDVLPELIARQIMWGYVQAIRYWAAGDLSDAQLAAQVRSAFALAMLSVARGDTRSLLIRKLTDLAPTLLAISER